MPNNESVPVGPAVATPAVQPVVYVPQSVIQPQMVQPQVVQPAAVQPQTVPVPQPAPPSTTETGPEENDLELRIYSHTTLFYWWPARVVGLIMTLVTYAYGQTAQIGSSVERFYPGNNAGVFFLFTLLLVILSTNITVRGMASGMVVLSIILVVVLLAYFGLWDDLLRWLGNLHIHLNLGFYFWFSTLLFTIWFLSVFVFDRMVFWRIRPGQVTQETIWGAASKSYDTENLVLEKHREDLFRHWILGLGAGDLRLQPYGANREEISIPNVLFVGRKLEIMQRMIATKPEKFSRAVVK